MWDNRNISWIFFDVGETLVDETKPIWNSIEQFVTNARKLGYQIELQTVEQRLMYYHQQLCAHPMRQVMEELVPSEADRIEIRKDRIYRKDWDEPYPEADEVLNELSQHYNIGIIANQSAGTAARLEQYGLLKYIKLVCASAEAGLSKPDIRFYEQALMEAACKPEHSVMIGDRIDNDVIPSKSLGMSAIWVRQGLAKHQPIPTDHTAPDIVVDRLGEIVDYFNKAPSA
jgi:HAD superfamily hydrolase (TIGR01662 family)